MFFIRFVRYHNDTVFNEKKKANRTLNDRPSRPFLSTYLYKNPRARVQSPCTKIFCVIIKKNYLKLKKFVRIELTIKYDYTVLL